MVYSAKSKIVMAKYIWGIAKNIILEINERILSHSLKEIYYVLLKQQFKEFSSHI